MENLTKKLIKYRFILFFLFTSLLSFATDVPEDKAKLVATNYLRHLTNQPLKRSGELVKLVYTPKQTSIKRSASAPLFYVFNQVEGTGFIIVSGDDNIKPILGYSLESNFDETNLSPQVAYWLSEYEKQIAFVVESNIQNQIEKQQWEQISNNIIAIKRGATAIKPLLKSTWNQSPYYNDLCPLDSGERTVTGCTATAIAQTMKFWNYPATGSGSHSYTPVKYGFQSANFGTTTYDWASMPNHLIGPNSEVAKLMYHIGVSVEMNYGKASTGGSGAHLTYNSYYQPYRSGHLALIDFFKYDNSSIQSIYKANYSDETWLAKIKSELLEARVIMYEGYSSDGKSGHAFVADGFDANNFIHFNWGWGGYCNGYFSVTSLIPSGTGTGGGTGDYTNKQGAVIGIKPLITNVPVADFSASTSTTSIGSVISLSDESTNYPNAWSWTITPNNATFVNGTSNTSKFPEVSFSSPGKYKITLTSTNSKGSNIISKTDFIIVNPALGKQVCDTMTNFLATEKKTYVRIKGGGSLAGHINNLNGFSEQYTLPSNFTHVSGALLDFARAETKTTTSTITVNLYQDNSGVPGTILTSKILKISDIKNDVLNGVQSKVMFDNPIPVNGLFYIGFETTNAPGDSVGIYTTQTTGVATNTAFMKLSSNNSWCSYEKCWNSLKIHLNVSPLVSILPSANFVINSTPTKTNTSVEIDASSSTNAYAYNWILNGANILNSNYYKESITYSTPGTYDIKLDAIGGCGNRVSMSKQIVVSSSCNSGPVNKTITETGSDSFTWNGSIYTQSGTYIYQTLTKGGCDSIVTLILTLTNPQNFTKTVTDTSRFFSFKRVFASPKTSSVALFPYYYPNTADPSKDSMELTTCYQIIPNLNKSIVTYKGLTMTLVSANKKAGFANVLIKVYDNNGVTLVKGSQKVLYNATTFGLYHILFDKPLTTSEDVYVSIEPQTPNDSLYVATSGGYSNSSISCNITGKTLKLVSPAPTTNLGTSFWSGQEVTGTGILPGTKIVAYNTTSKEYTLSQAATDGSNIVVTGVNLTFDDLKFQGGLKYTKFPVISGTKNPDFTRQPRDVSDVLSWINLGTTDTPSWKAQDAHITMYPIVQYAYTINPLVDNTCLGTSKTVNVSYEDKDKYFSVAKNPVLNQMAFYTNLIGYSKKNNYYYSLASTKSRSFKDTIDNSNPTFSYRYTASSDVNNDTLVVTDYMMPWGFYKTTGIMITHQKSFVLSSKINLTTTSKNSSAIGVADGKANVVASGGYTPYSYSWNNNKTTQEIIVDKGDYTVQVTDVNGCKENTSITVNTNTASTSTTTISACDSYTWNGKIYNQTGTYVYNTKNSKGNDSIATLILTINNSSTSTTNYSACGSYIWNGKTYTQSGKYDFLTKNVKGCDSVATLYLTVFSPTTSTSTQTANGSYDWNGVKYTQSGIYTYKTKNVHGCDSTATLLLSIISPSTSTTILSSCQNYTWNGTTYTQSGTYTYKTKNSKGNDSIATLLLTIYSPTTSSVSFTANGSYDWNGVKYTQSGIYTYKTKNVHGCDSTATLLLSIVSPSTSTTILASCQNYTWNGNTYTQSGTYTYKTKNSKGIDSIATLLLTVYSPTTSTITQTVNGSYDWNNVKYTQSGIYTYKTKNVHGCDSIATLVLTILAPGTSTTVVSVCDMYNWNNTNYTKSGVYTFTTKTNKGGDSTATLILTINKPSTSTTDYTACGSYFWNGKNYTKSGVYTVTTKNVNGCDSTATLNLTINPFPTKDLLIANSTITVNQANAGYQWLNCDANKATIANATSQAFKPTQQGNYAVKINLNGCVDTSSCIKFEVQTTGLASAKNIEFRIYPNPNNGTFNIAGLPNGTYKLVDMVGAEVHRFTIVSDEIKQLNLTNLAKGVYHIVDEERQIMNNKVVITD